jgi:hypothetical protein
LIGQRYRSVAAARYSNMVNVWAMRTHLRLTTAGGRAYTFGNSGGGTLRFVGICISGGGNVDVYVMLGTVTFTRPM